MQQPSQREPRYAGELLGFPERGTGSLASVRRRAAGLLLDWILAGLVATIVTSMTHALGGQSTVVLLAWAVVSVISVSLFARTPGQALLGMGVARVDVPGTRVGVLRAVARTLLTTFIFPAILVDENGMGMHDLATRTAVVRG